MQDCKHIGVEVTKDAVLVGNEGNLKSLRMSSQWVYGSGSAAHDIVLLPVSSPP